MAAAAQSSEIPFTSILSIGDEFEYVCKEFESKMEGTACICEIYKTQNQTLVDNFLHCKKSITQKRKEEPEEIIVYHGTTYECAYNIMNTGFLTKYSKIAAYGLGTYASPLPLLALKYCKDTKSKKDYSFIFVCKFLKGTYGNPIPMKPIDTDLYDYSGNNKDIYVTPYDSGILPLYLIRYYKFG